MLVSDTTLVRFAELSSRLGVSRRTLMRWVDRGEFPPPMRIGPYVAWRRSEIPALFGMDQLLERLRFEDDLDPQDGPPSPKRQGSLLARLFRALFGGGEVLHT